MKMPSSESAFGFPVIFQGCSILKRLKRVSCNTFVSPSGADFAAEIGAFCSYGDLGIVCSVITHINSSLLVYLGLYRVPMTKLQCIIWIYFTIQLDVKPCFMNQQHHMTTFEAQYKLGTIPSSLGVPYNIIQMFIKLPSFGSSTGPGDVIFPLHGREPGPQPQPRWARPRAAARDARGLRVLPLRAARAGGEGGHGSARWGVKVGETLPWIQRPECVWDVLLLIVHP